MCREHDAEQKCGDNINTFILAVIKFALPQCTYGTAMKETEVATPDSQHATNRLLFLLSLAMCQYADNSSTTYADRFPRKLPPLRGSHLREVPSATQQHSALNTSPVQLHGVSFPQEVPYPQDLWRFLL